MECWPRLSDITKEDAKQYQGWPITIDQLDNDGRKAAAWLPEIHVTGMEDPVVQVIDESNNNVLYTIRIRGRSFRPKVFSTGRYTLRVGEQPDRMKAIMGLRAMSDKDSRTLDVEFTPFNKQRRIGR